MATVPVVFREFLRRSFLPFCVFVAALFLGSLRFRGFVIDDDAIAHRLGERLATGHGATVNAGEYVHGVTALLGVLISAVASLVGLDPFRVASWHSSAWAISCGFLLLLLARRHGVRDRFALLLGAGLMVSLPFSLWSLGLVGVLSSAAASGWALYHIARPAASPRRLLLASLFLVLLTLCRIDGFVLALPLVLVSAWLHGALRTFRWVAAPFLTGWGALLLLQWWHFGSLFPDMASTKTSLSIASLVAGGGYLLEFLRVFAAVVVVVLVVVVSGLRRRDTSALPAVAVAGSYAAYLVVVGGDWMPGYRHFAVVLLLLLCALVVASPSRRVLVAAVLAVAVSSAASLFTEPATRALDASAWFDACEEGSTMLDDVFGAADPLLAVEPLGCPSWFTDFRLLDMVGLFEDHIAHVPSVGRPVSWSQWQRERNSGPLAGQARSDVFVPGHGKGDGSYVWSREPDLFLLCDPLAPSGEGCFRSWAELRSGFLIESRYQPLVFTLSGGASWRIWVRFDAGATGVRDDGSSLVVPSWLFARGDGVTLRRVGQQVTVQAAPGARATFPALPLSPGRYRVSGLPAGAVVLSGCAGFAGGVLEIGEGCSPVLAFSSVEGSLLSDVELRRL